MCTCIFFGFMKQVSKHLEHKCSLNSCGNLFNELRIPRKAGEFLLLFCEKHRFGLCYYIKTTYMTQTKWSYCLPVAIHCCCGSTLWVGLLWIFEVRSLAKLALKWVVKPLPWALSKSRGLIWTKLFEVLHSAISYSTSNFTANCGDVYWIEFK